ncbi:MAG: hypothetical protein EXS37_19730 [Opitutus sp.]|nr:hypothetical protein [Opitutus sp.]
MERTHGSLVRGQMAAAKAGTARRGTGIISFRLGLQALPDALAARLPAGVVSSRARIEALDPGAKWNVVCRDGADTQTESFDTVVAALPAPALAQLRFGTLGERPLASLDSIEHPPVTLSGAGVTTSPSFMRRSTAAVVPPVLRSDSEV